MGLADDLATKENIAAVLDPHTATRREFDFVQIVAAFRRALAQALDYQRDRLPRGRGR